jgi:ureidoglycolate lyase
MSAPDQVSASAPVAQRIAAQALTADKVASFGHLIAPGADSRDINAGTTRRYDDVAGLDVEEGGGRACVAIFQTDAGTHRAPYRLSMFERHRIGSQSFVPMGGSRCLAIVAGIGDAPDEDAIQAFIIEPGQGLTLRRDVWHHPLITIGAADILVIERIAAQVDCELMRIRGSFEVVLG